MATSRDPQRTFSDSAATAPNLTAAFGVDTPSPARSSLQTWTRTWTDAHVALHHAWFAFLDKRIKEDVALARGLVECKAPDDVTRVYMCFAERAVADYQQEFAKAARLGSSVATDALAPLQATARHFAADEASPLPVDPTDRKRPPAMPPTEH